MISKFFIERPVLANVLAVLMIVIGGVALLQLPVVTGIIALMIQQRPELGAEAIRKALLATGRQLEPGDMTGQHGARLVDAYQALLSLQPGDPRKSAADFGQK